MVGQAHVTDHKDGPDSEIQLDDDHLSVRVKPRAKTTRVSKIEEGVAFIDVAAPPEDNKANVELLKFLRRQTGRSCRVISGQTSKRKVIAFD